MEVPDSCKCQGWHGAMSRVHPHPLTLPPLLSTLLTAAATLTAHRVCSLDQSKHAWCFPCLHLQALLKQLRTQVLKGETFLEVCVYL